MKTVKIYSSKKAALNNITKPYKDYKIMKACTGGYIPTISEWDDADDLLAVYKQYRSEGLEKYVIIYGIYKKERKVA